MTTDHARAAGLVGRVRRLMVGDRTARLEEREEGAPLLSYLLVVTQSVATVLVLGHAQIPLLLTGDLTLRLVATLVVFLLTATVVAADMTFLRAIKRIPTLARNRATGALWLHYLYAAFVFIVEGTTYAVALAVVDQDPARLLSNQPLLPTSGPLFVGVVVLRALLLVSTGVMLYVVSRKLPPQFSTFLHNGKVLIGGHAQALLDRMELTNGDLAAAALALNQMDTPPRRTRTWWNRWLVEREMAQEREQKRQAEAVAEMLRQLAGDPLRQAQAEASKQIAEAQAEMARIREQMAQTVESVPTQVANHLQAAILSLVLSGTLPPQITELCPDLEELDLSHLAANGRPRAPRAPTMREPKTDTDRQRKVLLDAGIDRTFTPPKGMKGVWIITSDMATLTGGQLEGEKARTYLAKMGGGATVARQLAARFAPVMEDLSIRGLLTDVAREAYDSYRNVVELGAAKVDNIASSKLETWSGAEAVEL